MCIVFIKIFKNEIKKKIDQLQFHFDVLRVLGPG